MKYTILFPAIGLAMIALSACTEQDGGAPAETFNEQPAPPAAPVD